MPKRRPNEEVFDDGGKEIRLVADFGFLVAINSTCRDVAYIYADISAGLFPAEESREILSCAMIDVPVDERKAKAEDLITRYGLQECSAVAQIMLSHAMIGDVKKRGAARAEVVRGLVEQMIPSQSENLRRAGLLWAAIFFSSTALACLITSYCVSLTV